MEGGRDRPGDDHQAMCVVRVWPTGDHRQSLSVGRCDPGCILPAYLWWLPLFLEDHLLLDLIVVDLVLYVQENAIAGLDVHQVAEYLALDVVMTVEHSVPAVSGVCRCFVPADCIVGNLPDAIAVFVLFDHVPANRHDRRIEFDLGNRDPVGGGADAGGGIRPGSALAGCTARGLGSTDAGVAESAVAEGT